MMDEKERRKMEIRARLEQEASAKKKKKFMTPARKKRLRALLKKKAAEELKAEQERKAAARKKIIAERTGEPRNVSSANEAELMAIVKEYHERFSSLEANKYDLEYSQAMKDFEIKEIAQRVNEKKGKFKPPPLKKVSKIAQQMAKIALFTAKASQSNVTNLRQVKKFEIEEEKPKEKPEWSIDHHDKDVIEEIVELESE